MTEKLAALSPRKGTVTSAGFHNEISEATNFEYFSTDQIM
jgi:hypothetical protein